MEGLQSVHGCACSHIPECCSKRVNPKPSRMVGSSSPSHDPASRLDAFIYLLFCCFCCDRMFLLSAQAPSPLMATSPCSLWVMLSRASLPQFSVGVWGLHRMRVCSHDSRRDLEIAMNVPCPQCTSSLSYRPSFLTSHGWGSARCLSVSAWSAFTFKFPQMQMQYWSSWWWRTPPSRCSFSRIVTLVNTKETGFLIHKLAPTHIVFQP